MNTEGVKTHALPILIVEDDLATGELMMLAIAQETLFGSVLVDRGSDALLWLRKNRAGLIILDYRLPDMTGIELYDMLQGQPDHATTPILLTSATRRAQEIEPRNVILLDKPFEIDEFITTIEQMMTSTSF